MFIMDAILEKVFQKVEQDLPSNGLVDSTPVKLKWTLVESG